MYAPHHPHHASLPTLEDRLLGKHYDATDLTIIGETTSRTGKARRFGLLPKDRLRHVWIIGKTGTGKSSLLAHLFAQDMARRATTALLDPHGSLVSAVQTQASHTTPMLLRPADAHSRTFNIFAETKSAALLTANVLTVFRKQWSAFWGPRTEHILRHAILAVAPRPDATLLLLHKFLTNKQLQKEILAGSTNPVVLRFWQEEWEGYPKRLQAEALSPALNKLGAFVANDVVRRVVGEADADIHLPSLIDNRGTLLADLSLGHIGEDACNLLGGLLLTSIELAVQARPRADPPVFLYADEFHRFASESLPTLLSESRKFGLGVVLAHQYLLQLPQTITAALLGNVGTILAFRVGPTDAELLAPVFAPTFTKTDLMNLPPYHMAVRLLAHGKELQPFSAKTIAPFQPGQDMPQNIEANPVPDEVKSNPFAWE